jgi:hypothetical protein
MPPSSNKHAAIAAKLERDRADLLQGRADLDRDRDALAQERAALEVAKADFATTVTEFADHVEALVAAREAESAMILPAHGHLAASAWPIPSTICLKESFGFTENGVLKHWPAGRAITNADDIALLFERRAPIEGYDHV